MLTNHYNKLWNKSFLGQISYMLTRNQGRDGGRQLLQLIAHTKSFSLLFFLHERKKPLLNILNLYSILKCTKDLEKMKAIYGTGTHAINQSN